MVGDAYRRWDSYEKKPGELVTDAELIELAAAIRALAPGRHNRRDWSGADKDLIGVLAEREFSIQSGQPMVIVPRPEGDGGVDFWLGAYSVDVKGALGPWFLLREAKETLMASVLVLAGVDPAGMYSWLVGWEFDEELLKRPVDPPMKAGAAPAHRLHNSQLKRIIDLAAFSGIEFP